MKIICATNIPFANEAFGALGSLQIMSPPEITNTVVRSADILIVRSTLKVNSGLLSGSRVRFVGTCTIGNDHLDIGWLEKNGINWHAAPGCNANSVAEYVVVSLLTLAARRRLSLQGKTIGIIGVGNVGRLVVKKAEALGMRAVLNDPPLFDATGNESYRPLDEVLANSDIISVHVPLTRNGKHPTFHLAGADLFDRMKPAGIFINAARGAVMHSESFLEARAKGILANAVIDCWEGEPVFRLDVLGAADIATPHIAGHSFEGKVMGTAIIYRQLCEFLGIKPDWNPEPCLQSSPAPEITFDAAGLPEEEALLKIARAVYDVEADDRDFRARACSDAATRGKNFEMMRTNYHMRREFRFARVALRNGNASLAERLSRLQFQVKPI